MNTLYPNAKAANKEQIANLHKRHGPSNGEMETDNSEVTNEKIVFTCNDPGKMMTKITGASKHSFSWKKSPYNVIVAKTWLVNSYLWGYPNFKCKLLEYISQHEKLQFLLFLFLSEYLSR